MTKYYYSTESGKSTLFDSRDDCIKAAADHSLPGNVFVYEFTKEDKSDLKQIMQLQD